MYRIGGFVRRRGRSAGSVRRREAEGGVLPRRTTTGQSYFDGPTEDAR